MMMKKLPTNPFQKMTRRLLKQRAAQGLPMSIPFLSEIWESLLGEELSDHTRPMIFKDNKLTVAVSSDLWLLELKRHSHEILHRLNRVLPEPLTNLEMVADPVKKRRSSTHTPHAMTDTAPRLGNMPAHEQRLLEEVEDDDLRTLLTRIRRLERGRNT